MNDNIQFGQRNMVPLKFKVKLIVFYSLIESKDFLSEIKNNCNTCTCPYSLIPIYIELAEGSINETIVKKRLKTHVKGYKKDIDRVCIIEPYAVTSDQSLVFDTIDSFKTWLQQDIDKGA